MLELIITKLYAQLELLSSIYANNVTLFFIKAQEEEEEEQEQEEQDFVI